MFWVSKVPCGCGCKLYYPYTLKYLYGDVGGQRYLCMRCSNSKKSIEKVRQINVGGIGFFKGHAEKCNSMFIVYAKTKKSWFKGYVGICPKCNQHSYSEEFIPATKGLCKFIKALLQQ